jgi:DNA-binding LacI/PurR family transcriptional regulator
VPGGYTEKEGALAARQLLTGELPTAVIAANDQSAIGLLDIPGMARLAVQAVVEQLDLAQHEPRNLALPPHLVVRGTTSAPRVGAASLG